MKIEFFPDKSYSWLQIPVTTPRYQRPAHLTIKFFGEALLDHRRVQEKIPIQPALEAADFTWEPRFWGSPIDHRQYYVLAFTRYPASLDLMHRQFDIIKDQHSPWTPHVTVTKEFYLQVSDEGLTPAECALSFGEIELCLGGPNL